MANLVVRNLDEQIVQALKERAVRHRHSAYAKLSIMPIPSKMNGVALMR